MCNPSTQQANRQQFGKKLLSLIYFALMALTLPAQTVLWTNPITGTNPSSANPYSTGQTVNSYITAAGIGRGTGINGASATNRYSANGFTTSDNLSSTEYFNFILAPNAGYRINLSSFIYTGERSSFGPREFAFRHSSSSFATNIGSVDDNGATVSLTGASFQGLSASSEFRFYGWDAVGGAGTHSINDFTFNGSVMGTTVTSLSGVNGCLEVPGSAQTFMVNGNGLIPANGMITVTASTNYEVSVTSAVAGFNGTSVSFNAVGGNVAQQVWVRMKSTATIGAHNGEVVTVSGGGFAVGAGIGVTVNGSVPTPDGTISLTSPGGTQNQTVCINNSIADVDYTIGGTATAAVLFSGTLPSGVSGAFSGGIFTISGTPTESGLFNYVVKTTGATCGNSTIAGSITVNTDASLALFSGNDNQSVCQGSPIGSIIYSVGGSGTGGSVSGLPAGVTGVYSAGQITISGTPTAFGVFNYTVNTTGPCVTPSTTGTITVYEASTISLQSGSLTNTLCINTPLTTIELTRGGSSTGWSSTGALPDGVTAGDVAGVFTISGTPTSAGSFSITVTADGPCPVSQIVSILVNDNSTLNLSSAAGTDAQALCINTPITNITYAIGGGGTGANVTGLPAGVSYNFSAGVLTISGSPTIAGSFSYTVNSEGPCINPSTGGTIDVTDDATITLTSAAGTDNQTVCINNALTDITYAIGGTGTGASIISGTLPAGLTGTFSAGTFTISGTPAEAGSFNLTITTSGACATPSANVTILINDNSTLNLSSAVGTDVQTLCINTPITNITYAIGGGGTGASVSGLPAGMSYNFLAGVLTISGTPTEAGSFSYTVTTTGPCINPSLGGTIEVTADATITLTSGAGSDNQTFCINNALPVNITYAVGGTGTGISVQSGTFPAGISGFFDAGVYTITGFGLEAGTFNIVLTSEGPCATPTASVTLVVQDNSSIALSSSAGTDAQTVCINTAITPISYAIGGGGTGATVSGLPTGVSGSFNAGIYTISGTPTQAGSFSYTVTTTGPCVNVQSGGTIDVTDNGTISLSSAPATANQVVCNGLAITDIVYAIGGSATSASITAGSIPAGLSANYNSGVFTISGTPTAPGSYYFTVTATGPCVEPSLSGSIVVNALPTLDVSPASVTICVGDNTALTASSNINYPPVLVNELFNVAGSGSFSAAGSNSGGGTAFQNFTSPSLAGLTTITNNNSTRFMMASVAAFGSANTNSQLTSPVINTIGYSSLSLSFRHTYDRGSEAGVSVQVSTDPGNSVWQNINTAGNVIATNTYTANQGANNNFVTANFNLNNFLDEPNLRIRFNYVANVTFSTAWWAIDDVNISGTPLLPLYSWSADTGPAENGLPPNAGTFLSANSSISVDPTLTTTYTLSVKHPVTGCENTGAQSTVTVNQNGTIDQSSAIGTEAQTVCINTAITDITYNVGGAATGAQITAGSLPAGLTGTYSGGVFTISGTPTEAGTFPYTVSTTGSLCINPSLSGSITVTPDATISLSSAVGTDAQTVCINTAITDITYAVGGSGDDASITSGTLPSGVTGSYNGGVYTISGTPSESGSFSYTITASGPCESAQISGIIEITADGTIGLSSAEGTDAQSICINTAVTDITYTIGGTATGANISAGALPNGMSGSFSAGVFTITGTPTESGSFSYTVSATGSACVNPSLSGTIEVIAEAVVGSVSGPTAVCEHVAPTGVAAVYTCSSTDPASVFNWLLPAGASNITGQGTNTISFVYPSGFTSGTIAVDVTSTCGAIENRTLNVGATTPDMPGVVTGITNVCPYIGLPDQLTYSIAPVAGALSYEWIVPPSCTLVSGQGSNSINISVGSNFQSLANKVIRVRVMSGCGNSSYQLKYLQAQFPMTPGPITGINDVCEVINTPTEVTYSINKVLAATSYVWTVPAGATATHPNGPGINDTIIKVVFDNSFVTSHISVISVNNCLTSGSSRSLLVYRNNPPTPGLITGPTNACEYSVPSATQAYYTIRKVPVATSYTWTVPPGASITHENAPGANDTAVYVTFPNGYSSGAITVKSHNGCGTSGIRSLSVARLNVGMPSAIDIQTGTPCPVRQFVYSIASMPYNATSLVWTVPAGGTIDLGQGTTSIQVSYSGGAIAGNVTVQAFNNCSQSLVRTAAIKLPACPPEPKAPVKPEFSIADEGEVMDVSVFPNPSTSHFKIRYNSKEAAKLRVMDALGKVLYEHSVRPGELLQIGDKLKAGTYFIEVQQGNRRKTFRAIKF